MKKFVFCVLTLFVGIHCSKEQVLCGCVMPVRNFSLSIKNTADADLLDPNVAGSFKSGQIKVTFKDATGVSVTDVAVKEPFTYGDGMKSKFTYYQLVSSQLADLAKFQKPQEFYIDLGDGKLNTLTFDSVSPEVVKLNGVALSSDKNLPEAYGKVYYWVK